MEIGNITTPYKKFAQKKLGVAVGPQGVAMVDLSTIMHEKMRNS